MSDTTRPTREECEGLINYQITPGASWRDRQLAAEILRLLDENANLRKQLAESEARAFDRVEAQRAFDRILIGEIGDKCKELRSENANLKRDKEWQPIATAPKGRDIRVDLWCVSGDRVEQWREPACWWNADRKQWCNIHMRLDESNVTHWMPLPEPPAMESTASEGRRQ